MAEKKKKKESKESKNTLYYKGKVFMTKEKCQNIIVNKGSSDKYKDY